MTNCHFFQISRKILNFSPEGRGGVVASDVMLHETNVTIKVLSDHIYWPQKYSADHLRQLLLSYLGHEMRRQG